MIDGQTVSVVVPARDEAATVESTLGAVASVADQLIVVDDGSRDETGARARRFGAEVVRRQSDPGKGQSLARGLEEARGDIIVFVDADLGDSAREVEKLVYAVTRGGADLAVACIQQAGAGGWGLVANSTRCLLTQWGVDVSQPLCGQRALRRTVLPTLLPLARGWGVEVDMLIKATRHQLAIHEVPLDITHVGCGRGSRGWYHRARQGAHIALTLGRLAWPSWS